ncbi:MAG: S8 family peptidase [Bacteroidetes bacterium]|nr:S8 family peptidase [Bacteroidota bacterium]
MMRWSTILCLFLQASLALSAQSDFYWIKFKDKASSPFQIGNPTQFLSQKSIERRNKQAIPISENDLPVSQAYIDSISPFIHQLVHRLKWFNMVVVKVGQNDYLDSIRQFSFVDSLAPIWFVPSRSVDMKDKFESVEPVDQNNVDSGLYGIAYNQIRMLNADLLHQLGYRGQGITVAMMDNGFVRADSIAGFDSIRPRIHQTWNFVRNQMNVYTDGGHGTNTFSCIAGNVPGHFLGTAPDADFFLYETEDIDDEWVMEEYNWAAAAEMADSSGADILSTSLGYTTFRSGAGDHTYADLTGDYTLITRASNMAFSKGMLVLNSAGNSGDDAWFYITAPADGTEVMAVGAVNPDRTITGFSSRGPNASGQIKPDVCAQGSSAAVLDISGNLAMAGGTSFSCPILAGCAASLWGAFPEKSAQEIRQVIIESADRFNTPDNNYGYGIPNFYNAYLQLLTAYNPNTLNLQAGAVIYPIPFTDELNLSLYNEEEGERRIELFDLLGRKVYSFHIFLRAQTYELVCLDGIQSLSAGEYILRMDGQKKYAQRILKMK